MLLHLTKLSRTQRTSVAGKPYTSLGIQTQEHGDKWLNGFGNPDNAHWKEGDTVDVEVKEVPKGDRVYLNFEMPQRRRGGGGLTKEQADMLQDIQIKVSKIMADIASLRDARESPF